MKRIIYKILYICLFASVLIILNNVKVQAANASLTATTTEPTEGQSVTVTANVTAGAWNLQFTGNGKSETIYGYTQSNANATDSKAITFTAGSAGTTYTFTLTGDMTDITSDNSEPVSKSIKITVKAPVVKPPAETKPETPATNNNTPTETKKSSEARLKNFGIRPNDFSGFKKDKLEYSTTVPNNVSEVEIYAEKQDGKATVEGTGKVSLKEGNNTFKVKVTAEDGKTTKTYTLNIKRKTADEQAKEDGETRLKSLGIKPEEYDFTGFNAEKTEYSVQVPNEVEEIEVYATATNSKAQITGIGMITLKEGVNELPVEVIAVDGTKKIYKLMVTRAESENVSGTTVEKFGLSTLSIQGLKLSPSFNVGIYEYKATLTEDISSVEITANANDEEATIEIIGNENLEQGENIITILVKNEEKEENATYQIIVNKNVTPVEETVQTSWLKPSTWGKEEIIKLAIILVLIILIIIAIILKIKITRESKNSIVPDLPGADELDKAIAEHQELAEEEIDNEEIIQKDDATANYLEEIAKSRLEESDNSDFAVEEFEMKLRKKGKHF